MAVDVPLALTPFGGAEGPAVNAHDPITDYETSVSLTCLWC